MAWQRWNTSSHIFEYSIDNGVSWLPQPINAALTPFENPIPLAFGGTGASLIATGGPGKVLKQKNIGQAVVVEQVSYDEIFGDVPLPPGCVIQYAGVSAPGGWRLCDGSLVGRIPFRALFNVIGTIYGVGDGSTTFALPDCRSRSPVGTGQGAGLTARALAATGGEELHVLLTAELATHNHPITPDPHSHGSVASAINLTSPFTGSTATYIANMTGTTGTTSLTSTNAGSNTGHNTMHPFISLNFIIKT